MSHAKIMNSLILSYIRGMPWEAQGNKRFEMYGKSETGFSPVYSLSLV